MSEGTASGPADGWEVGIDRALHAHFFQEDGSSRPGVDYAVSLRHGGQEYRTFVRAFLSPDLNKRARRDQAYQVKTVIGYVFDCLDRGWRPEQGRLPDVTILNPDPH